MFRLNKVFLLCALISALLVEKGIYGYMARHWKKKILLEKTKLQQ